MSQKVLYLGSTGPFLFDPDHDMPMQPGVPQLALRTDSQMIITQDPTDDENVVRLKDLDNAVRAVRVADIDNPVELTLYAGWNPGSLIVAYQDGDPNYFTLYAWDDTLSDGDSPYVIFVVDFNGGWVAIAGKNNYYTQYFWSEGDRTGIKMRRGNYWVYFQANSTYNGISVYKVESV
jgi:hypothetical protein